MIRDARLDDLDRLVALEEVSFGHDRFHRRQLRHLITRARGKALVCETAGEISGALFLSWRWNSSVARIISIAVSPECRGSGIGRTLVRQAETLCRARDLKRLNLEVRQDNQDAIDFYEGCGYTRVALIADYYSDSMTGIRYQKSL